MKHLTVISRFGIILMALFCSQQLQAGSMKRLPLDSVKLKMTAETWVKTNTARVIVNIAANLTKSDMANARVGMLSKLQRIAKSDWHITQFNRTQDQSGLEKINVVAETRISENQLNNLHGLAKDVSKAGETYRISNIDFSPSESDIETARTLLQDDIYKKANALLAKLNTLYPEQHYTIHIINFAPGWMSSHRRNARNMMMMKTLAAPSPAEQMSVSNKLKITAKVILSSNRKIACPTKTQ